MTADPRSRRFDHAIGATLCLLYVGLLVATAPSIAMSRDESFYARAGKEYTRWIERAANDPGTAFQQKSIDRYWDYNWEHPALMKTAFGLSAKLHRPFDLFPNESTAFRFPGMLVAGLLVWLIYAWGALLMDRRAAFFAAVSFALMPRVFYHSHLAAFDIPIAFFAALTAYAYWRSLSDRRWAWFVGVAFGLALATKHNAWILPGIFLIHYAWLRWDQRHLGSERRTDAWWLLSMVTIGPAILIATWPWVWNDTWARLAAYAQFHVSHVHYTYAYLGQSYFEPPMPMSVPFVMTLFTVPLTVLVLAVVGTLAQRRALSPPWHARPGDDDRQRAQVLLLGCLFAPMLAIALPTSPIFGGTKHWITAYPFIALFAGYGIAAVLGFAGDWWRRRQWLSWSFVGLCLLPGLVETSHSHPFGLSHYTPIAGGTPGAADLGMNRQFWGFTTGSLATWLTEHLPEGGSVWICDMTPGAFNMMRKDGLLPGNIRVASNMASADFALVHHEDHFVEVDFQAWVAYGSVQPVHVLKLDGVPIISVYENPKRAIRRLPAPEPSP